MYFAITQGMAEWLLPKVNVIEEISDFLVPLQEKHQEFSGKVFIEGPIKIAFAADYPLICMWHQDYLIGTGDESFGFVKIDGPMSLITEKGFIKESFERSLYLINQRLQGLLIEGAFYHRKHDDNIHTLLAGRGSEARHYSLGYYDLIVDDDTFKNRKIIINGPSDSFRELTRFLSSEIGKINDLSEKANDLINHSIAFPIEDNKIVTSLRSKIRTYFELSPEDNGFTHTELVTDSKKYTTDEVFRTLNLSYEEWMDVNSPLNESQRKILMSEALDKYPLRILGPGGSGKTLLMLLLTVKKALDARSLSLNKRIMYIVHSNAMKSKVIQRIQILLKHEVTLEDCGIEVITLSEYCRNKLQLDVTSILDPDAADAKAFQLEQVRDALYNIKDKYLDLIKESKLLNSLYENDDLMEVFSTLVLSEISISIKGHGLEQDRKRYVESERQLSRLHGILNLKERDFVYSVFEYYHHQVFENYGSLDPDDLALSLYGSLKTPIWRLRRKNEGFDYIFVDEAQLFNENERRLFSLLSKEASKHVPIALALDEAQSFYGQTNAGLATLGIKDISNQSLESIHRSTIDIAKLAFFVIQRSTHLFSPDFPDFTNIKDFYDHVKGGKPSLEKEGVESPSFSKFILRRVRDLRSDNVRQIAIICHIESYWKNIEFEFKKANLPFLILRERGEKIKSGDPVVVLCRPDQVGGQEFDAVVIVGLEKSALAINNNPALSSAIEQQMIRETYLSITRARYRLLFVISKMASESEIISDAINAGLIIKS
ncbi:UvrD-helicase domain-containing protein [Cronobacter dublinensis]|uniref:UvrD-helicase domain-containing protein n=1 Tax=Cronobacter dublinensis TaxID=413497 RepID=UPI0024AF7F79|nr:UvrD-helicase domain-containing protein [Cronobacter dublinensis]MDI7385982.1 UvrD-helicase domain-containing protein [Cronobacter dublinensis]